MTHSESSSRWIQVPAAAAVSVALGLSGCTGVVRTGGSLSDWTSAIGARWDRFVDEILAPLTDTGLAILGSWLGLAVAARLVAVLLPPIRNLRVTRRTGKVLRIVGWLLVLVTPLITVFVTATATDALTTWLVVSTLLAIAALAALGPGLATRSRLDAKVIASDGSTNGAWSIDALMQVRDVNLDDPRLRVERPTSPDLGDFISIADRSGIGVASVVAWLLQTLFNSAPWMLQVTILDNSTGIAALRRNGQVLDEVQLRLEWGSGQVDQHRKLLALAAAFTAMKMADRYPDVRGFYRATNWLSVGYLGLAQMSEDEERRYYLNRAVELEPRSLLAEYDRVFHRFFDNHDRQSFEQFMDRLEPLANQAAWMCGAPIVFPQATRKDWHDYPLSRNQDAGGDTAEEGRRRCPRSLRRSGPTGRSNSAQGVIEPPDMLLRALMLYTFVARNWDAQVGLEHIQEEAVDARRQRIHVATGYLVAALKQVSDRRMQLDRLERIRAGIRVLRDESRYARHRREAAERQRKDPSRVLERMRARTALCYVIFCDGADAEELTAAADPMEPVATSETATSENAKITDSAPRLALALRTAFARIPKPAPMRISPVDPNHADVVKGWLAETKSSVEIETRYSYACYLARRAGALNDDRRRGLVDEAIRRVRAASLVDYYKHVAAWDPELKLLGHEPGMRELVLSPIRSPWEISRLGDARTWLARHGILDPAAVADEDNLGRLFEAPGIDPDELTLLVDASTILRAAEAVDHSELDLKQRWRAVRLLVEEGFTVLSFCSSISRRRTDLVQAVAGALFWVPTELEAMQVERFLVVMAERLGEEARRRRVPEPVSALADRGDIANRVDAD